MDKSYYQQVFEIQAILDKRANPKNGKIEYLVQWKDWPKDYTWEPKSNIQQFLDQNELFVDDEDLKKHYKQKQKRRKFLREERNNQVEKICNSIINHSSLNQQYLKQDEDSFISNIDDYQEDIIYQNSFSEQKIEEISQIYNEANQKKQQIIKKEEFCQDVSRDSRYIDQLQEETNKKNTELSLKSSSYSQQKKYQTEKAFNFNDQSVKKEIEQQYQNIQNKSKINDFSEDNFFENQSISTEQILLLNTNQIQKQLKQINNIPIKTQKNQKDNQDGLVGDFKKDNILSIEMEIKYFFKVRWQKRNNGDTPLPKNIKVVKKKNISPHEMIGYLNQSNQIIQENDINSNQ